jgi:ParB/RepB/Spo0J family partition protein
MRRSLARHGQLEALSVFTSQGQLEILDGFKRVRAARALGLRTLRARVADVDRAEAKILLLALHDRRGLTELEEAWLIRSLYRDEGLSQPTIAARLGRHKSWVFRRLMLVEALDPAVQADVRLGLLAPRAAAAVSQLPRGNQHDLSAVVIRRGLTVRQTELVVAELLDLPDDAARAQQIARRLDGPPSSSNATASTRVCFIPRMSASRVVARTGVTSLSCDNCKMSIRARHAPPRPAPPSPAPPEPRRPCQRHPPPSTAPSLRRRAQRRARERAEPPAAAASEAYPPGPTGRVQRSDEARTASTRP